MGLAQEQLGQTQDALAAFLRAQEVLPQSEMVRFFVGREYLFLSDLQPDRQDQHWQAAEDALLRSIDLNAEYARAYIGLGALDMNRSSDLVDKALVAGQPVDPQARQWVEQAIAAYQKVLELKPDPQQYGNPVEEVARLGLGNAYRLKGTILLAQGEVDLALEAFDEAIQQIEASQPVFEAALPEHESYRRYLVQAYEYLGTVYQWQGQALETKQDYDGAIAAYDKSIAAFGQCISVGAPADDLVIQDDILKLHCQPKLAEVQQRYDELTAGN
jgi:tetratricopeptide (TPR) repeat protein